LNWSVVVSTAGFILGKRSIAWVKSGVTGPSLLIRPEGIGSKFNPGGQRIIPLELQD
jgi:hypothetical protein